MRGARIPYSAAELAFIKSHATLPRRELLTAFAQAFGRSDVTIESLKSLCTRNGWNTGRQPRWTVEADALLRELYPNTSTKDVAQRVGRTLTSTYQRADRLGLKKTEAYLASEAACRFRRGDNVDAAHRFKKGQAPANKGLRRPGWGPGRMSATQFTKGQLPHNTKWAGHERVSKDGYVEISIEQTNPHTGFNRRYVLKHKWLWEQQNGPLPKGMALKCVDSNKLNTDPSNWTPVPRGVLPRLNGRFGRDYDGSPAELKPTILAIAKLEHAARAER